MAISPPIRRVAAREAYVASRFDTLAGRFKREVAADDFRLEAILRRLGGVSGLRVLDLGCGKGRFATRLADRGARVVGVDPSPGMLRGAKGRGLAVAVGSARRLPIADGSIDAVVAVEVFEHLDRRSIPLAIAEALRVLRAGGRLIVVDKNAAALDPCRPWLPAVLVKRIDEHRGRWMYPSGAIARERWFWPGELRRAFSRGGFDRVAAEALTAPEEARRPILGALPIARRFVIWSASKPGV